MKTLQRQDFHNRVLLDIFADLSSELDPDTLYQRIVEGVVDAMPGATGGSLLTREGDRFVFKGLVSHKAEALEGFSLAKDEVFVIDAKPGEVLQYSRADIENWEVGRLGDEEREQIGQARAEDWPGESITLATPIFVEGELFGSLAVDGLSEADASDELVRETMRLFAAQAAIAIKNAMLVMRLRESEMQFRSTVDNSSDAIIVGDENNVVLLWNSGAEEIFGYSADEMIGQHMRVVSPHVTPEKRARGKEVMRKVREKGDSIRLRLEDTAFRKDGRPVQIEYTTSVYRLGEKVMATSVIRDVTEQRRMQKALRRSEELNRGIVENSPLAIIYLDAQGTILYENPATAKMMGVPPGVKSQSLNTNILELPGVKSSENTAAKLSRLLKGETVNGEVLNYRSIYGVEVCLEAYGTPIIRDGQIESLILMLINVTERERVRKDLKKSEERFSLLVRQSPLGIVSCDTQGNITSVNPAMLEMLGSPDENVTMSFNMLTMPNLVEAGVSAQVERCLKEDLTLLSEHRYRSYWGKEINLYMYLTSLKDENGEITGTLITVDDVTEKRVLETRLKNAEKLAAIGELVAGVAHELNNPLTAILGISTWLQDAEVEEEVRDDLERIEKQAKRAARIVDGLLKFAHRRKPEPFPLNVNILLEQAVQLIEHELRVKNVRAELNLAPDLPPVMGDSHQLQQAFINIVHNANQAIPLSAGGGTIEITAGQVDPDTVQITIADDGEPIPPDVLPKIFEPFFTTKEVGEGTGLGLAICHGIIEAHGGQIWAQSPFPPDSGKGAAFFILLPVSKGPDSTAPAGPHEASAPPSAGDMPARILVVDDEEVLANLMQRSLISAGYQVDAITNGQEASARLRAHGYDLIVTDIKMPVVSGIDLYRHIRDKYPALSKKVLFTTGDTLNNDTRAFLEKSRLPYLRKPFTLNELIEKVRGILTG